MSARWKREKKEEESNFETPKKETVKECKRARCKMKRRRVDRVGVEDKSKNEIRELRRMFEERVKEMGNNASLEVKTPSSALPGGPALRAPPGPSSRCSICESPAS